MDFIHDSSQKVRYKLLLVLNSSKCCRHSKELHKNNKTLSVYYYLPATFSKAEAIFAVIEDKQSFI